MTRNRVLPRADADIRDAADEYTRVDGIELGLRLYEAVERTWSELAEHPEMGAPVQWESMRFSGIRQWRVPVPFNVYLIDYRLTGGDLVVVRVLHGARDHENTL